MDTAEMLARMERVHQDLKLAEQDLDASVKALAVVGEKAMVSDAMAGAFQRVRDAKREIAELTALLAAEVK
jgi:hypothetical protein